MAALYGGRRATHSHAIADVSGLQAALDSKLDDSQAKTYGLDLLDSADAAGARSTLRLGTAATQNVGTSASNVVQLDGSSRLPAVDGSQLTNVPSGLKLLTSGTVSSAATLDIVLTSYTGCRGIHVRARRFRPATAFRLAARRTPAAVTTMLRLSLWTPPLQPLAAVARIARSNCRAVPQARWSAMPPVKTSTVSSPCLTRRTLRSGAG